MFLKPNITLFSYSISTIWIFVVIGLILYIFTAWYESKKDGFTYESFVDFSIVSIVVSSAIFIISRAIYSFLRVYVYNALILKYSLFYFSITLSLLVLYFLSNLYVKRLHWSIYRSLDTLFLSLINFILPILFGEFVLNRRMDYLIQFGYVCAIYALIYKSKTLKIKSGYGFSFGLFSVLPLILVYYKFEGYLIFVSILFTIALVSVIFRRKKAMQNGGLTSDFLKFIKEKLEKKDKELKGQQDLLHEEDPYMQSGRGDDNSEEMDEAILEDGRKELTDKSLGNVNNLRNQISKALSFLKIGKYGICEVCGKPIDKARLEIYPEATKCLDCSNKGLDTGTE